MLRTPGLRGWLWLLTSARQGYERTSQQYGCVLLLLAPSRLQSSDEETFEIETDMVLAATGETAAAALLPAFKRKRALCLPSACPLPAFRLPCVAPALCLMSC